MIPVVTTSQMTKAELNSEKNGVTRVRLMQNAANAILNFLVSRFTLSGKSIIIIIGSGNNGGDGAVLSKLLGKKGAKTALIAPNGLPNTETSKNCLEKTNGTLPPILSEKAEDAFNGADIIIDCVFGTGFHGELPENIAELFKTANLSKAVKISVDIPSGVNGNTGVIAPHSFRPDITLVLAAMKTGLLNLPCADYCGEAVILDIGITDGCYNEYDGLFTDENIKKLFPRRPKFSNKGTFGKLLNIAGCNKYIGAAVLSSKAALRSGAGLVCLASVPKVTGIAAAAVPECVFKELKENCEGCIGYCEIEKIVPEISGFSAAAFGCGVGNTEEAQKTAEFLLKNVKSTLIIDADGINAVSANINVLKDKSGALIMTPHPGEFARLTGTSVSWVQSHRIESARDFALKYDAVLLLKGANTIVAAPDGRVSVNTTGNSALAKAGCGDVLTGIIGALAAQGVKPFEAAVLGAYLHGEAADFLVKEQAAASVLASEVADALGKII